MSSRIGPAFWNLVIDCLFKQLSLQSFFEGDNSIIQAYADDCLLAFAFYDNDTCRISLQIELNSILNFIFNWGTENFLKFNKNKTCVLYLPIKRNSLNLVVKYNNEELKMNLNIWVFGLIGLIILSFMLRK